MELLCGKILVDTASCSAGSFLPQRAALTVRNHGPLPARGVMVWLTQDDPGAPTTQPRKVTLVVGSQQDSQQEWTLEVPLRGAELYRGAAGRGGTAARGRGGRGQT